MPREASDPGVCEVMTTLDLAIALQRDDRRITGKTTSGGTVDHVVQLVGMGGSEYFDEWPDESIRAIVLCFVRHAPADVFEGIIECVREHVEDLKNLRIEYETEVWPEIEASLS